MYVYKLGAPEDIAFITISYCFTAPMVAIIYFTDITKSIWTLLPLVLKLSQLSWETENLYFLTIDIHDDYALWRDAILPIPERRRQRIAAVDV